MNDGTISLKALAPQIVHRVTPLNFRALRAICKNDDNLSYERIMNAIRVSFKSAPHVQMVLRVSLTNVIVVWKHPYTTHQLWRREIELNYALVKTIEENAFKIMPERQQG